MAIIGVLIENMFEDSEYQKPAAGFKKAKHELVHLGVKEGIVKGETAGIRVKVEKAVSDVVADDFDALFIPGGYSPDLLRSCLLYTSPSPRDGLLSRMPSSA